MNPWGWIILWAALAIIALLFMRGAHVDDPIDTNQQP
jgi:hypothetical protein